MVLVQLVEDGLPVVGAAQLAGASGQLGRPARRRRPARARAARGRRSRAAPSRAAAPSSAPRRARSRRWPSGASPPGTRRSRRTPMPPPRPPRPASRAGRRRPSGPAGSRARSGRRRAPGWRRGRGRSPGTISGRRLRLPSSRLPGMRPHARHGGVDQLLHRAQPMQEEAEDAGHARVEVDVGLPAPDLEVLDDLPPAQGADHEVAVDAPRRSRAPPRPRPGTRSSHARVRAPAPLEGGLGQVVELLVVLGQAEAAGANGRFGELGVEEVVGQLGERRHASPSLRPGKRPV